MDTEIPQIHITQSQDKPIPNLAMPCPFVEWNGLLLGHFFSPAAKGEETWLQTTIAELDSIGLRLGGAEGLIAAVQEGPPWLQNYQNIAEAAVRLVRQRVNYKLRSSDYVDPGDLDETYRGYAAPTYLPYLALWVIASSESEEGFYASVERLSSRPFSTANQSIRRDMLLVWKDLEAWTCSIEGIFGNFAVRVLGDHQYVGMPRSQCLISPKDRRGLNHLFSECGLRPRQDLNEGTFRQIASIARHAYYISRGLQEAFNKPEYADPLKRMLNVALQSWDGKIPRTRSGVSEPSQHHIVHEHAADEISIVLRPSLSSIAGWEIHWRIPAIGYAEAFNVSAEGFAWKALIEEAGTHALCLAEQQHEACRVLASALDSDIEFTVSFIEAGDENGIRVSRLVLPKRSLRTLVWDAPDPSFGTELIEGEIPLAGPCYLLFHNKRKAFITREFSGSRAGWELVKADGLPAGWWLGCILSSELLSSEQRRLISDSYVENHERARMRLVGGRPILRGGGKTYAFYDLPILEVEAPRGAALVSEGLELSELSISKEVGERSIGIRRFSLRITDDRRALFQIRIVESGDTLAATTLKVSVAAGKAMAQGRNFGLGPLGRPSSIGERLVGVLRNENGQAISGSRPTAYFAYTKENWKPLKRPEDLLPITDSVGAKFLDSLAQLGSIAFGNAREQLQRLAHQTKAEVSPALFLLDLRSRGYLEIESDDHGHLVRIHAVPPTLYSIPVQYGGRVVRAVCGTFRLQSLLDIGAYLEGEVLIDTKSSSFPVFYIVPNSERDYEDFVEIADFRDACMPASSIANWASGVTEARLALASWGWESLATEIRNLQRFNPGCAQFKPQSEPRLSVDLSVGSELYRFEDPTVQALQVYVLGSIRSDGRREFSFLQDSRWGIWLSMNSFAEFVRRVHGIGDVVPWPIHYSGDDGTLWLPARMRPPFVIERILVLCSGSSPRSISLGDDGINLSERLSPVYTDMAAGIWLAYRWIPKDIAAKVASLLGGRICYI